MAGRNINGDVVGGRGELISFIGTRGQKGIIINPAFSGPEVKRRVYNIYRVGVKASHTYLRGTIVSCISLAVTFKIGILDIRLNDALQV